MRSKKQKGQDYASQNRSLEDLDEYWKPIGGYDKLFYHSNFGRVKSFNQSHSGKIIAQRLYAQ